MQGCVTHIARVAARAHICQDPLRKYIESSRIVHQVRAPTCRGLPRTGVLTPLTSELHVHEVSVSSVGTPHIWAKGSGMSLSKVRRRLHRQP